MKKYIMFFLLPLYAAAHPADSYTDLKAFSTTFANQLGELLEDGQFLTSEAIRKQLVPLRRTQLDLAPANGKPLPPEEIYRNVIPSAVQVGRVYKCGHCEHWHESSAGGFILHKDGYIATNYHVMQMGLKAGKDEGLGVRLHDGRVLPIREIVASDRQNDLAIVRVDATDLTPLPIANDIAIGAEVYVLSSPEGIYNTFTKGMVSNKTIRPRRNDKAPQVRELNITADFAKGSSGSPVLNSAGELVGVVRSTRSTYYDQKNGVDTNLQMVWKDAIPSFLIQELCTLKPGENVIPEDAVSCPDAEDS